MHVFGLELKAIGQILLAGVIAGAGLPLLFALGIRASAWGTGGDAKVHSDGAAAARTHPLGRVVAGACFAIVLACVVLGLVYIVASGFGKELSFSHVFPTIVTKSK